MALPSVTILIANYNDEEYLDRAIESAVNQDYPGPVQICIVDDGSTDGSWGVIAPYINDPAKDVHSHFDVTFSRILSGRFGNTKVIAIKNENSGPSQARNVGIEYTLNDTDIYAILDSDDEMYENKISECVNVFESGGNSRMISVTTVISSGSFTIEKSLKSMSYPISIKALTGSKAVIPSFTAASRM